MVDDDLTNTIDEEASEEEGRHVQGRGVRGGDSQVTV